MPDLRASETSEPSGRPARPRPPQGVRRVPCSSSLWGFNGMSVGCNQHLQSTEPWGEKTPQAVNRSRKKACFLLMAFPGEAHLPGGAAPALTEGRSGPRRGAEVTALLLQWDRVGLAVRRRKTQQGCLSCFPWRTTQAAGLCVVPGTKSIVR